MAPLPSWEVVSARDRAANCVRSRSVRRVGLALRRTHRRAARRSHANGRSDAVEELRERPVRVRRGGDDELVGLGAQDVLLGDRGNDVLIGEGPCPPPPEGDYCDAGMPGDDVIVGGSGDDYATGDRGNDQLISGTGRDDVRGGRGDDVIRVRDGQRDTWDVGLQGEPLTVPRRSLRRAAAGGGQPSGRDVDVVGVDERRAHRAALEAAPEPRRTGQRFHAQRMSECGREHSPGSIREARTKGMRSATTQPSWRSTEAVPAARWNAPPATSANRRLSAVRSQAKTRSASSRRQRHDGPPQSGSTRA
jgi:hypothetical protein